jgi:hypothetical protein
MSTLSLRRSFAAALVVVTTTALVIVGGFVGSASAAQPPVGLGTAVSFAVLAGSTVTNTGPSVISGSLGLSPGSAVTGFPPGRVQGGSQYVADGAALQAKNDLTTGYNDAAGRTPATVVSSDLGGQTLVAGVYQASSSMGLTGTVTLNGNASAVFIFQAGSTLTTASNSTVKLIGGAQACNVFWQVGSSATLGTDTTFVGSVMALTSATVQTGTTVDGRILARNGAVTLDDNTITVPTCTTSSTATTTAGGGGGGGGSGTTGKGTTGKGITGTGTTGTGTVGNGLGGGNVPGGGLGNGLVPEGPPQTGLGGASRSGDNVLLVVLGGLALAGAGVAMGEAIRRRRMTSAQDGLSGDG